jgi:hypothetical protein
VCPRGEGVKQAGWRAIRRFVSCSSALCRPQWLEGDGAMQIDLLLVVSGVPSSLMTLNRLGSGGLFGFRDERRSDGSHGLTERIVPASSTHERRSEAPSLDLIDFGPFAKCIYKKYIRPWASAGPDLPLKYI